MWYPLLLNTGFILMALALAVRHALGLRSLLALAQASLSVAAAMHGNFNAALWQALFCLINLFWTLRLWRERRPIEIPDDIADLYHEVFPMLSRREFMSFWQTGRIDRFENTRLVRAGDRPDRISLVLEGEAVVRKQGRPIARLKRGQFFAEMSFVTGEPASADVEADGVLKVISWEQDKLRMMHALNPPLYSKIQSFLSRDLTRKLHRKSEG